MSDHPYPHRLGFTIEQRIRELENVGCTLSEATAMAEAEAAAFRSGFFVISEIERLVMEREHRHKEAGQALKREDHLRRILAAKCCTCYLPKLTTRLYDHAEDCDFRKHMTEVDNA